MKKFFALFLVLLLMAALVTGASADDGKKVIIRLGTLTASPNQCVTTAEEFKTRIEEVAGDRIEVQVYPSAQLGTAAQMLEGMQAGSIEGALFPANFMMSVAPIMGFVEVPGIVGTDSESFCKILNSHGNEEINEILNANNLHIASWLITDDTKYMLTKKEITSFADLKGLKLWGFPNAYNESLANAMGASPVFFDTSDLPVSMQQGTIDGVMAAPSLYAPQKLYEYAKYCLAMPNMTGGNAFIMGKPFLDSLPEDLRELVLATAMEVTVDYEYEYAKAFVQEAIDVMVENGVEFSVAGDALYAEFEAAYGPMLDIWLGIDGAPALYEVLSAQNEEGIKE